jgi:hypothetical protein
MFPGTEKLYIIAGTLDDAKTTLATREAITLVVIFHRSISFS